MPQSMLKIEASLKFYEDGEICLKSLGIVFIGKKKKGKITMFLFQVCDGERYTTSHYTNFIIRMNSCVKNNESDKPKIRKVVKWCVEIRRVIHQVAQTLMT